MASSLTLCFFFKITYSNTRFIPLMQPIKIKIFVLDFTYSVCRVVNFSIGPHVTIFRRLNGFQLPCVCVFDERSRAKSQVYFISIKTSWFHRLWSSFLAHITHTQTKTTIATTHDIDVIRFPNGIQEFLFSFIHSFRFQYKFVSCGWLIVY